MLRNPLQLASSPTGCIPLLAGKLRCGKDAGRSCPFLVGASSFSTATVLKGLRMSWRSFTRQCIGKKFGMPALHASQHDVRARVLPMDQIGKEYPKHPNR